MHRLPRQQRLDRRSCSIWVHIWHKLKVNNGPLGRMQSINILILFFLRSMTYSNSNSLFKEHAQGLTFQIFSFFLSLFFFKNIILIKFESIFIPISNFIYIYTHTHKARRHFLWPHKQIKYLLMPKPLALDIKMNEYKYIFFSQVINPSKPAKLV